MQLACCQAAAPSVSCIACCGIGNISLLSGPADENQEAITGSAGSHSDEGSGVANRGAVIGIVVAIAVVFLVAAITVLIIARRSKGTSGWAYFTKHGSPLPYAQRASPSVWRRIMRAGVWRPWIVFWVDQDGR